MTAPMTDARLAEIETLSAAARGEVSLWVLGDTVPELLAEVRRLRAEVEPLPDAELTLIGEELEQHQARLIAAQNALIDHDRDGVIHNVAHAGAIAESLIVHHVPGLLAEVARLRAELVHAQADLLDIRGHLSPNGYPRRVPMELGDRVAPAVEWLLDRVDMLKAGLAEARAALIVRPVVTGHCPACGRSSLFLGDGGYVTCAQADCPQPDAASAQLAAKEA